MSEQQQVQPTSPAPQKPESNPPKPKPSKPEEKNKKKKSGGGFAVFLALLAIAGVGGASAYGWMELDKLKQQLTQQAHAQQTEKDQALQTFKANLATRLDGFNKQQQTLKLQLKSLQGNVSSLAADQSRDQRGWVLAEAEYLINMANSRLRLLRDVKAATEALKGADQRIASLSDPGFFKVREILVRDIVALQSLDNLDANGVALKLLALNKLIQTLPAAKLVSGGDDEVVESSVGEEGSLLAKFSNLIGLKKSNRPYMALPRQEDIFYLDQLMRLEIEAARHAVLRLDAATYHNHIDNARKLLSAHYAQDNPQVQKADSELKALAASKIFPKLPDISQSFAALRQVKNQQQAKQETSKPVANTPTQGEQL